MELEVVITPGGKSEVGRLGDPIGDPIDEPIAAKNNNKKQVIRVFNDIIQLFLPTYSDDAY